MSTYTVSNGATLSNGGIPWSSGGINYNGVIVLSGGFVSGENINSGGTIVVSSGGIFSGSVLNAGATAVFSAGASESVTLNGGTISAYNSPPYLAWGSGGGTLILESGAVDAYERPQPGNASIFVNSGATLSGNSSSSTILQSGNTITVSSGGSFCSGTINAGATAVFSAGANEHYVTLNGGTISAYNSPPYLEWGSGGGTLILESGAVDTYERPQPGNASIFVNSGATLSGNSSSSTILQSGNTITVSSGGSFCSGTINAGATAVFSAGASESVTLNGGTISAYNSPPYLAWGSGGGTLILESGALDAYERPQPGNASIFVNSGATLSSAVLQSGNAITVSSGGILSGATVNSGATFSALSGATLSGVTTLQSGATATIWNNAGGAINLPGNQNAALTISGLQNGGTVTTVISGWSGSSPGNSESIDLPGVSAAGAVYAYPSVDQVVVTLANGKAITFNIPNVKNVGFGLFDDGKGGSLAEVCFLAGSLIRTPSGLVAVEDLTVDDEVVAYFDGVEITRRVIWAGKAQCNVRPHLPDDEAGYPVRILKDAIADGVPFKDMLITAEHCLFFDGNFVPTRMLVNGRSIFYDRSITSYDYYHIETEQHSVIMADGVLTESYLDTGNRRTFRQDGTVVSIGAGRTRSWDEDAAGPLAVSRDVVEPLFRQVEARAKEAGMDVVTDAPELTDDANLHFATETGMIVRPSREANGRVIFMIPTGIDSVRIVSNTSRPSDAIGPFVDDRRHLGVLIGEITLFESGSTRQIETHLIQDDLAGWDVVEASPCRWTNGNAVLPLGTRPLNSVALIAIQIKAAGPYIVADILSNQAQKKA